MSKRITVRLPDDLATWLGDVSRRTRLPVGRIVQKQLNRAKAEYDTKPYMLLAGKLKGLPADLSMRKGFSVPRAVRRKP